MIDFMMDDRAAKERERLSKEHVATINAKIEARFSLTCRPQTTNERSYAPCVCKQDILFSVDSSLLDSISEFVAASGRSPQTQQAGGEDELDLLLAQLAKPAKLEIPTALLFVGGMISLLQPIGVSNVVGQS